MAKKKTKKRKWTGRPPTAKKKVVKKTTEKLHGPFASRPDDRPPGPKVGWHDRGFGTPAPDGSKVFGRYQPLD